MPKTYDDREIDFLWCKEMDAMLVAATKILEREKSISPSSFYGISSTFSYMC